MNETPEELELRQWKTCDPSPGLEDRCRRAWIEHERSQTSTSPENWRFIDLAPALAGVAVWMLALVLLITPPAARPDKPTVVREDRLMPEEQILWRSYAVLPSGADRKQAALDQRREILRRLEEFTPY